MTDKELLEFCKQRNVELSVGYDKDADGYRLRMERGWLQINYVFSLECINTANIWDVVVKSKLDELEENLTRMERAREEEKNHD